VFRIFFLIVAVVLVFAKDWKHYTNQNTVYDVARADNGTTWAAFKWGLQERSANGQTTSYMPGSNGLEAANFVQIFALPDASIIAVSENGIIVRKNGKNFETINNSYVERKRNVLPCLGKRAGNILILPFNDALAFFDHTQNRSVVTISQIGDIKRIAVKNDTIWLDLGSKIWKRKIIWNDIHKDISLTDLTSWDETNAMPADEKKCAELDYVPGASNFPLKNVNAISVLPGGALAWGDDYGFFSKMQNGGWSGAVLADQSGYLYGNDQRNYLTKSVAMLPNGDFAFGFWGAGVLTYNSDLNKTGWFHSNTSDNKCPTEWSNKAIGNYTIVQGIIPALDYSGYIFSYFSEAHYGLGFVNKNGNITCKKSEKSSSGFGQTIIARSGANGEQQIYVAWKNSLESKEGGVDFYSPDLEKKWSLSFGSPIDFAFDSKGVLWAVSSAKIFYLDLAADEWKEPSYIRGFDGGTISSLAADAHSGLWIGTGSDGAYFFSQINGSPDSLTAKHFKIKDGLLSETINDIAIDTAKGLVYFAHDLGLSVYSTAIVRSTENYMQSGAPKPIAYPNPFRPELHSVVKIDYLSENAVLYIFDSSGKRVRYFKGSDLQGGMAIWDGKNESGKPVAPGLYHFMAADKKNIARGKILVER